MDSVLWPIALAVVIVFTPCSAMLEPSVLAQGTRQHGKRPVGSRPASLAGKLMVELLAILLGDFGQLAGSQCRLGSMLHDILASAWLNSPYLPRCGYPPSRCANSALLG